ncbi:MAG: hypothetical protein ACYS21_04980, partial [Planctomycetota bacterium]
LKEALESLEQMIQEIESQDDYCYGEYIVDITHLYHHLNIAWNARDADEERVNRCSEEDFYNWRQFPVDDIYLRK